MCCLCKDMNFIGKMYQMLKFGKCPETATSLKKR